MRENASRNVAIPLDKCAAPASPHSSRALTSAHSPFSRRQPSKLGEVLTDFQLLLRGMALWIHMLLVFATVACARPSKHAAAQRHEPASALSVHVLPSLAESCKSVRGHSAAPEQARKLEQLWEACQYCAATTYTAETLFWVYHNLALESERQFLSRHRTAAVRERSYRLFERAVTLDPRQVCSARRTVLDGWAAAGCRCRLGPDGGIRGRHTSSVQRSVAS